MSIRFRVAAIGGLLISAFAARTAPAQPSAQDALRLNPIQKDVDYYVAPSDEAAKCKIKAERIGGQTGWVVRRPNGEIIRQFVDTNADNVVDRWCYFKDGFEVYRDIDENFNGKADQYRWLNAGGTRWGLDRDEDGKIDSWKMISAEEVSAEAVMSLRDRDVARFSTLLITPAELKSLGLGKDKAKEFGDRAADAPTTFKQIAAKQKIVTAKSTWTSFAAAKPGLVPAGTSDSTADIVVYQDAIAMVETGKDSAQLPIGTIVKVGDVWRLVDVPLPADAGEKIAARITPVNFYPNQGQLPPSVSGGVDPVAVAGNEEMQKLIKDIDDLDNQIRNATGDKAGKLNERRADLQEKLADLVDDKDRPQFLKQLADTVSAAVQGGTYPKGVERLTTLLTRLQDKKEDDDLLSYVKYRVLQAQYAEGLHSIGPGTNSERSFTDVSKAWNDGLKQFVKDYPKSADTAEALLQLGTAEEFAGQAEKAKAYYNDIVVSFSGSSHAKKATGAVRRLDSVGKVIEIKGTNLGKKAEQVDLAKLKGKVVLIHYWASWCEPCKAEFAQLKEMKAKYGKNFELIGINLDSQKQDVDGYLSKTPLPWAQLWEPGGLESKYGLYLGIVTLPTMVLIDEKGKVANRGLHITELDNELKALIK